MPALATKTQPSFETSPLTFLGFSYGTYLGATYASLFPENVRALALDGAVSPSKYTEDPIRFTLSQNESANQILVDIFEFCAANAATCPFAQGKDPLTAYRALVNEFTQKPLEFTVNKEKRQLGGFGLTGYVRGFMSSSPKGWLELLADLASFERRDPTPLLQSDPAGPQGLSGEAFFITSCNDKQYPKDPAAWDAVYEESFATAPDFAVLAIFAGVGCVYLDYETDPFVGPFSNDTGVSVLVVGGTKDSQTPYSGSVDLTKELGNARLLTFDGYGHVSYRPANKCIRDKVDAYLISGALPPEGTVCTQAAPGSAEMKASKGDPESPAPTPSMQFGLARL
jgi:pimeloyl-ACP methyl ester carboxylesterase